MNYPVSEFSAALRRRQDVGNAKSSLRPVEGGFNEAQVDLLSESGLSESPPGRSSTTMGGEGELEEGGAISGKLQSP